jgi:hypothetical protein
MGQHLDLVKRSMMPVSSDFFTTLGSTIGYQRYIETGRGLFKSLAPLVMRLNMALGEPISILIKDGD